VQKEMVLNELCRFLLRKDSAMRKTCFASWLWFLGAAVAFALAAISPLRAQESPVSYTLGHTFPNVLGAYSTPKITSPSIDNSQRLHALIHDGKLELSVQDAIALAIENNLDIAAERYTIAYAQTDLLRTLAGGAARGVSGAFQSAAEFRGAIGGGVSSGGSGGGGGAGGYSGGGGAFSYGGASCCDPVVQFNYGWNQDTTPLGITLLQGVPTITQHSDSYFGYFGQGFLTGTSIGMGFYGVRQTSNSITTLYNPEVESEMVIGITQPLLNGFGYRVNARFIRIANNDIKFADSAFRQRVITTLTSVLTAYWNVVSARESVKVARDALDLSQKTLSDLEAELKIGAIAPFDVVRSRSEVASRKQELIIAQTTMDDQEQILKAAIAKDLTSELEAADIVPLDPMPAPKPDDIPPVDEALKIALENRPEIEQAELNLRNQEINVKAIRNGLLPSLNAFATYAPSGLSGVYLNRNDAGQVISTLPGGAGTAVSQVFRNQFPDYSVGFSLTIPIRNREGQADAARSLLEERQLRIQYRQKQNLVIQDVRTAIVDVLQAKSQMEAAHAATLLAQQTLDGEQEKFQLGESTIFFVIQDQRDLFTAEGNEVKAHAAYVTALLKYQSASGTTMDKNGVVLEDAERGEVSGNTRIPGMHKEQTANPASPEK
jgi:outer membrane protein